MPTDASTIDSIDPGQPEHSDTVAIQTFGFWIYLMTDLVLFAAIFATYAVLAGTMPATPATCTWRLQPRLVCPGYIPPGRAIGHPMIESGPKNSLSPPS